MTKAVFLKGRQKFHPDKNCPPGFVLVFLYSAILDADDIRDALQGVHRSDFLSKFFNGFFIKGLGRFHRPCFQNHRPKLILIVRNMNNLYGTVDCRTAERAGSFIYSPIRTLAQHLFQTP